MTHRFGKYELLGELGSGGMAVVYKARDTLLDRVVALKVISQRLRGGEGTHRRFLNEARVAASLSHPNIVAVYELGVEDDFPFIAMEYLPGRDLRDLIDEKRPLTLLQKVNIALQVARALEHAHGRGVIHRDIKPGNIRVLAGGGVKLLDFGIAKLTSDETARLTRTGAVMGTAAYMSPEQLRGESPGAAADVFAFGIVLYELLTYRKPFEAPHPAAMVYRILNTDPEPLTGQDLPQELLELVAACLQKAAAARPEGFEPIVRELGALRKHLRRESEGPVQRTDEPLLFELPEPELLPLRGGAGSLTAVLGRPAASEGRGGSLETTDAVREAVLLDPRSATGPRGRAGSGWLGLAVLIGLLAFGLGAGLIVALGPGWSDGMRAAWPRRASTPRPQPTSAVAPTPRKPGHEAEVEADATPWGPAAVDDARGLAALPTVSVVTSAMHVVATREPEPVRPPEVARSPVAGDPLPAPEPTEPPAPEPARPSPTPAAAAPTPEPMRLVRLGGAPAGTRICVDGQVWRASRVGLAWVLQLASGAHTLELVPPEKGTARRELEVLRSEEPQVVILDERDWTSPRFRLQMRGHGGAEVSVLEHRGARTTGGEWQRYTPARTLGVGAGGLHELEGSVDEAYRIELRPKHSATLEFQWSRRDPDIGELRVEHSGGTLSAKRCARRPASGACGELGVLDCGSLD